MIYVADFETTTDPLDCRVWAWCTCRIDDLKLEYGNNIHTFIEWCIKHSRSTVYFHNLKFDGQFIIDYLAKTGYKLLRNADEVVSKSVKILMSRMNLLYSIDVMLEKKKRNSKYIKFIDSLKKIPLSVDEIAKAYDLPIRKLEIDYSAYRGINHVLTDEEKDYISNDVLIVAMALRHQFDEGMKKMTMGSDAFNWYKKSIGESRFKNTFPVLSAGVDEFIRKAYKGGISQVKESIAGKVVYNGLVADVNSMYPWAMRYCKLPYGLPIYYLGVYQDDKVYDLFIQHIKIIFKVKDNHIPIIQLKGNLFYKPTQFIKEVNEYVDLYVTSVDLKLIKQQYDIIDIIYIDGYKFKSSTKLFVDYIDYWIEVKKTSTGGKRFLAKRMLNSLYGKFATNPDVTGMYPYYDEKEKIVKYKLDLPQTREPVYTALACFVTAWGRHKLINAIQDNYDRFLYCDTDSIHVLGFEPLHNVEIHKSNLGSWALEAKFYKAKYLRAKTYAEVLIEKDGKELKESILDVKCAGMTQKIKDSITFDDFEIGYKSNLKLRPVKVNGGIILENTPFTIH